MARAAHPLSASKPAKGASQTASGSRTSSTGTRKKERRGRHDADLSQTYHTRDAAGRTPENPPNTQYIAPASLWAGPRHHVPVAERPANEPPSRKRGRGTAHAGPAAVGRRIIGQAESPMGCPAQSGLGWSVAPSLRAGARGWVAQGFVGMTSKGPFDGSAGHFQPSSCELGPAGAAPDRRSGPCLRGVLLPCDPRAQRRSL